jgi:hypothetical protein
MYRARFLVTLRWAITFSVPEVGACVCLFNTIFCCRAYLLQFNCANKSEWSNASTSKLIAEMETRTCLWDKKRDSLREIAVLGSDVGDIENKIRNTKP